MSAIVDDEMIEEDEFEAEEVGDEDDHQEVWGGGAEVSPEGEELEEDTVEEDDKGTEGKKETEREGVEGEKEAGEKGKKGKKETEREGVEGEKDEDGNPIEVQGYGEPEDKAQETIEESFEEESKKAYHEAGEAEWMMERVLGRDDRKKINNTTKFPWRTICSLQITAADDRRYIGSGNFIGPHTVMTAGHCIYMHKHGGWVKSIKVVPGANGSHKPFGFSIATRFVTVKGWIRKRYKKYDYGAVILRSNNLGKKVGWMGFAALRWINLIRLRVNNAGYPGDKSFKTMWWNCNRIVAVTARRVFYKLDTYGGQSGSPVWRYRKGRRHQIAIHAYGGVSSNSGARITKAVFKNMKKWKK